MRAFRLIALLIALCAHAHTALATEKVLRISFRAAETGFDPQRVADVYSQAVCAEIFEPALEFDYLARPVKLVPSIVETVPTPQAGGLVYVFRIKPGIFFNDDPVFKGQRRELVADDLAYALKRLIDPNMQSQNIWLIEGRIAGLDALAEQAKKTGHFDYDAPVTGLQVTDRYTLRVTLTQPDFNFLYIFAMPPTAPLAREVMEHYAGDIMAHPVGTGPFRLKEWVRRSKIVLERNPNFRGEQLDTTYADPNNANDREVIQSIAGKRLPLLDRIEIYPIEMEQPFFLAFMNGEHDLIQGVPATYITQVLPNGHLSPTLSKAGVRFYRELQPELTYDAFNMEDPIVGGYDAQHVALRRAIILGHNREQAIRIIGRNTPMAAQSPIPPGVVGYDAQFTARDQDYDPARAQALLDLYDYVDRDGDGYREQPDGSPLLLQYKNSSGGLGSRLSAQLWIKSMKAIGLHMEVNSMQFADLIRDQKAGQYMMTGAAWLADYPDAQNFLQLLYGPNIGAANVARFNLPLYNQLFAQAAKIPDSPERNTLYREMCRYVLAYAPWRIGTTRSYVHLLRPWVKGYKKNPLYHTRFKYLDIDVATQQAAKR